jgi:hypothetical protein
LHNSAVIVAHHLVDRTSAGVGMVMDRLGVKTKIRHLLHFGLRRRYAP